MYIHIQLFNWFGFLWTDGSDSAILCFTDTVESWRLQAFNQYSYKQ